MTSAKTPDAEALSVELGKLREELAAGFVTLRDASTSEQRVAATKASKALGKRADRVMREIREAMKNK